MLKRLLLALLLVAVAGCLDPEPDGADATSPYSDEVTSERLPAPDVDLSAAIDPDHGGAPWLHAVPALHVGSYGMELVGYNPLTRADAGDGLGSDSGYAAIDTWQDLVCVTHFAGATGAQGGATIVDISDPTNPVVLSTILSGALNSDCQFTDDGRYLLLATYTGVHDGLPLPPPIGDLGANGVAVYEMSEPTSPQFMFHDVLGASGVAGNSYHNVFTATINETYYVFQTYSNNVLKFNDDMTGLDIVSTLDHTDHDLWVGRHPITNEWVAVTGAGRGTAVINLDDPANPRLLGIWEGDTDNRLTGWHRQWPVDGTIDGRAYVVVAGEECGNGDSLPYTVLDWTDPASMVATGSWWIPGQPANPSYAQPHLCEMNSHEFEVWDGYVATGNYHAGVWLFDVGSPERVVEPVTIGYYLPSETPQARGGTVNAPFVWSPDVWGAYFDERGYVITADWWSGLYILSFGATESE
jgi:hypothetical protein